MVRQHFREIGNMTGRIGPASKNCTIIMGPGITGAGPRTMLLGRLLGRFGISFRGRKDGVAGGGCNKSFLDRLPPSCLDFQRAVVEPLHDLKRPGVRAAKAPGPQQWRTCPGSRARKPDDAASPRCWATSRRGIPGIPAQSPLGRSGQRQRDLRVRLGHAAGAVDVRGHGTVRHAFAAPARNHRSTEPRHPSANGDGHRPCAHPVVCFVALFCPSVSADEHGVDDRRDGPVSANSLSRLCGYPLPAQPKLRDDRLRRHPPPVLGQSPPQSHIKGQVTSIARSGGLLFSFRS